MYKHFCILRALDAALKIYYLLVVDLSKDANLALLIRIPRRQRAVAYFTIIKEQTLAIAEHFPLDANIKSL
jgi:hypothetical protein